MLREWDGETSAVKERFGDDVGRYVSGVDVKWKFLKFTKARP